jgi:hypothetical protein
MKSDIFIIIIFLILIFIFSCEEQGFLLPCKDCTTGEPTEAYIEAKLDFNANGSTRVQIYEGNIEDNVLFGTWDATSSSAFYWHVPLNKKYTFKATYFVAMYDDTYIALDAITPRVKFEKSRCDDPCYIVYDKVANLKVRYNK